MRAEFMYLRIRSRNFYKTRKRS